MAYHVLINLGKRCFKASSEFYYHISPSFFDFIIWIIEILPCIFFYTKLSQFCVGLLIICMKILKTNLQIQFKIINHVICIIFSYIFAQNLNHFFFKNLSCGVGAGSIWKEIPGSFSKPNFLYCAKKLKYFQYARIHRWIYKYSSDG